MNPGQLRRLLIGLVVGPLLLGNGHAEPIYRDYDVFIESANVYNDRIGYSRFFAGSNTDVLRVSAFVWPSPDSDARNFDFDGQAYRSTNGSETTVTLTHSSSEGFERDLTFVGLASGGGGALNEYTTILDLANPYVQDQLAAWDATPFTLTATNPSAPNTQEVSYTLPDYDSTVLLPFLTDVAVSGDGLSPTISWVVPETDAAITNAFIQIRLLREVDGQLAGSLVHTETISLDDTQFTIEDLNRAALFGLDPSLQLGSQYEVAVILEQRVNGRLMGRARTFFEFVPMEEEFGAAIYLPSVGPDGVFRFDIRVEEGELIYIDPVVAIGYDYQIGEGDPMFASVTLPDVGDGLYELWLFDLTLNDFLFQQWVTAGEEYFFAGDGVDRFRILGIEASAGLDPSNVTAFVTGLTFADNGRFTGTMTPITLQVATVPEPPVLALFGLALVGMALSRRYRRTFLVRSHNARSSRRTATHSGR